MLPNRAVLTAARSRILWRYSSFKRCMMDNLGTRKEVSPDHSKGQKILRLDTVNPAILDVHYAVRGPIVTRAGEIEAELTKGVVKDFDRVIRANIGDCHAVGQIPITFFRQVLAGCCYPELLNRPNLFPRDVVERSRLLLKALKGSVGCYTESAGSSFTRNTVANYISARDGYPSNPSNIFLTNGASSAVKIILYALSSRGNGNQRTGVMVPIPQYPLYSATLSEYGSFLINYYLDEENEWRLDIDECVRAYQKGRGESVPRAMVVINPGNPTGQLLSYENMVEVVKFCKNNGLILMADEVYQQNIHDPNLKFHSFKKVVLDCGFTEDNFELVSFHSGSKGFYGECGLRAGYMELFGFAADVKAQLEKLASAQLCSCSTGQVIIDCVVNPPKPGDCSYELFVTERDRVHRELKEKADLVYDELNSIPGIKSNRITGAMYAFPRLFLSEKVVKAAEKRGMTPDEYYCHSLLESTGICVVPGSGFKQTENTYHFRTTILPPIGEIRSMMSLLGKFNADFLKKHS